MKELISCEFNIDTGCVEAKISDGSMIAVNCTAVENEVADNNTRLFRTKMRTLLAFFTHLERVFLAFWYTRILRCQTEEKVLAALGLFRL